MADEYLVLEKKIAGLPEECLDEVSAFVDYIAFRAGHYRENDSSSSAAANENARMDAVNAAFGLWSNHDNSLSVDETVRQMRKGRHFDN